jgi:uncharacterized protein (DUF433 family)
MADHPTSGLISVDPGILGGKPVIAGTRFSVQLLLEKLHDGWTIDDLLEDFPQFSYLVCLGASSLPAQFVVGG